MCKVSSESKLLSQWSSSQASLEVTYFAATNTFDANIDNTGNFVIIVKESNALQQKARNVPVFLVYIRQMKNSLSTWRQSWFCPKFEILDSSNNNWVNFTSPGK